MNYGRMFWLWPLDLRKSNDFARRFASRHS
jgi:hypothetical protein